MREGEYPADHPKCKYRQLLQKKIAHRKTYLTWFHKIINYLIGENFVG